MYDWIISILKNIKNRLGTPFLSAFLFGYIAIHWKVFYVVFMFGDETFTFRTISFENSFDFINKSHYYWYHNTLFPLLIGLGYAIFIPIITYATQTYDAKVFERFTTFFKVLFSKTVKMEELERIKSEVEDNKRLIEDYKDRLRKTEEDNIKLRKEISKLSEHETDEYLDSSEDIYFKALKDYYMENNNELGEDFRIEMFNKAFDEVTNINNRDEFNTLIDNIARKDFVSDSELIKYLLRHNFLIFVRDLVGEEVIVEFTKPGEILRDKYLQFIANQ